MFTYNNIQTSNTYTNRSTSLRKNIFVTFSLRKHAISIIFITFTVCLVIFSTSNLYAAKSGLKLWANNVIPSLFPFFIATNLLSHTNILTYISKLFNKIMRPIFNVPGECAFAFILGLISGYPVGAKIVVDLRNSGLCTKDEADRMLCFTNNSGPLFIIGTVGITLFSNSTIGILLLATHILSALTIGILLGIISRFRKSNNPKYNNLKVNTYNKSSKKICTFSNLGEILSEAIFDSAKTIIMIGGFVVIFSVIISILNKSKILGLLSCAIYPVCNFFKIDTAFTSSIISGIIELTNGVSLVCNTANKAISQNIIICAFLLGVGGFSVLLQVLSIISKSDLSIKKYFYSKFIQGIIAALYTYILLNALPVFYLNL